MKTTLNPFENAKRIANGAGGGSATIPPATADRIGGVKIGNGINVTEDGTISASYTSQAYSTEEHKTGRKWIDGKDIYEKVVVLASAITVGTSWTDLGLANSEFDTMIHANGLHSDGSFYPLILDLHNSEQATTLFARASANCDVSKLVLNYTKTGA